MKAIISILILLFLSLFPSGVYAKEANQFITLVNPVRISSYTKDPVASLNAEYEEIRKRDLSATWLLTYDVINRDDTASVLKELNTNQELGIFIEITPQLAKNAGVIYKKEDSWHRANSLFLSGYTQEDRKKIIDTVFDKFKKVFGYYPTSVGSWWIDSFSLGYMKNKYGITANLTCSDQFATDGYRIWGQYWSTPFYPSKYHAGMPAQDASSMMGIVTLQWAPRDPLNGYQSSLYSTQDYFTIGLSNDYFEKIIRLYGESRWNKFGQITLGLEGDFLAETYKENYAQQMQLLANLRETGSYQITTMKQFSDWYRSQFKDQIPDSFIESNDLLGKSQKAIWYQSPNYRLGMVYDSKETKLTIIDLRTYLSNFVEPYYLVPNFQIDLYINIPSVIDSISNPQSKWEIANVKLQTIENRDSGYQIKFEDNKIIRLTKDSIIFEGFGKQFTLPLIIRNSPKITLRKADNFLVIGPQSKIFYDSEGLIFSDLSIKATYFFWRPKVHFIVIGIAGVIATSTPIIFLFIKKPVLKLRLLGMIYLPFIAVYIITLLTNSQVYSVNQSEIDALDYLAALPYGQVAVIDNGCLICKWQTEYPPPAFAGKKNYVGFLSRKPIIYNKKVFEAKTREQSKLELNKLRVKYIYLVKYEGYIEEMPFSPGDLNVEKIYENANAQIWQVKNT